MKTLGEDKPTPEPGDVATSKIKKIPVLTTHSNVTLKSGITDDRDLPRTSAPEQREVEKP